MTTSLHITNHSNNTVKATVFVETKQGPQKLYQLPLDKYVIKDISIPKKRFRLSDADQIEYVRALGTKEGRMLLNRLKNGKTDGIINSFFGIFKQKPTIKELMKVKLVGRNHIEGVTIGLTKKEIWDALVEEGLVTTANKPVKIIVN